MTLKTTCKCGSEFYISTADESEGMRSFAHEKYNDFISLHRECCDIGPDKLPEDWKV